MVVSSPTASKQADVCAEVNVCSEALEPAPVTETVAKPEVESGPRPSSDRRNQNMSQFPPRLSRRPRPKHGPHAQVNLPQLSLQQPRYRTLSGPRAIPPLNSSVPVEEQAEDLVTLTMRPARTPVSGLWHRLRFNRFFPMARQRRSSWKPGKPRRGRPEGTKGAGSRSI